LFEIAEEEDAQLGEIVATMLANSMCYNGGYNIGHPGGTTPDTTGKYGEEQEHKYMVQHEFLRNNVEEETIMLRNDEQILDKYDQFCGRSLIDQLNTQNSKVDKIDMMVNVVKDMSKRDIKPVFDAALERKAKKLKTLEMAIVQQKMMEGIYFEMIGEHFVDKDTVVVQR
jgi:hypothetical protein